MTFGKYLNLGTLENCQTSENFQKIFLSDFFFHRNFFDKNVFSDNFFQRIFYSF